VDQTSQLKFVHSHSSSFSLHRFAKEGFAVALISRDEKKLLPVKEEIEKNGGKALAVPADATDAKSLGAAFERIRKELGHPQVLIYNAGAFQRGSILELTPESFERCWKVLNFSFVNDFFFFFVFACAQPELLSCSQIALEDFFLPRKCFLPWLRTRRAPLSFPGPQHHSGSKFLFPFLLLALLFF
jgi:NAD(P)-dependent dehydrogenase (short-subunit alcohol dehydrogenase family)